MRLLIISHTPHYRKGQAYVGWGPTIREINHLASIFQQITHIAPLHQESPPQSALEYESSRITLRPVPPAGGAGFFDKLSIFTNIPLYVYRILRELGRADVVHVRCPANISLVTLLLLSFLPLRSARWFKYAGNWHPEGREPKSYRLQRWWLSHRLHRGIVTINGSWPNQPSHVHSFFNPCLTDNELAEAEARVTGKKLSTPIRLLYVGHITKTKGVEHVINILCELQQKGLNATLDLVGDGLERPGFEKLAETLRVHHLVKFHGWLPRTALAPLYGQSHFMVFPSSSEGWPKVLSEAIAYGVVPISSDVSSIPQYLKQLGVGKVFRPDDVQAFTDAIIWYCSHPATWKEESQRGIEAAGLFSYRNYLQGLRKILNMEGNELELAAQGES